MNIFFINCTRSFPKYFNAENTKFGLMAKGFKELGHNVYLLNRFYGDYDEKQSSLNYQENIHNGIHVISFKKPNKKTQLFNNYYHSYHFIKENKSDKNLIIASGGYFLYFIPIILLSFFLKIKIGYVWHEWLQSVPNNNKLWSKLNNKLSDKYCGYFVDYIYPISHFLKDKSLKFKKPYRILPIIADYSLTPKNICQIDNKYYLYCACVDYQNIISTIIESYVKYKKSNGSFNLILEIGTAHV